MATFELGPNATKTLATLFAVVMLALQIWNLNKTDNAEAAADKATAATATNTAQIKRVRAEVRDGRNDTRRTMGLPPVVEPVEE
jgi:hypothetical protein